MSGHKQPDNDALPKGTTVYIAGFDTFETERDTTVHDMLVDFHEREYPDEPREREWIISNIFPGSIDDAPKEVRRKKKVLCFGHMLYM